jgi:hypothetical protein
LYDGRTNRVIEKLYDVILRIRKENECFGCDEEDTYIIGIEQSILRDIPPSYARYRVSENGKLVRI